MLRRASFGRCTFLADPVFAQNSEKQRRNSQGFRCSVVGLDWSQPRVSAENVTLPADNSAANNSEKSQIAAEGRPSHIIVERCGRACYRPRTALWRTA